MSPLVKEQAIAVVGAGAIGCAIAWALAREGRLVLLIDRSEPGTGGASFGNVGHIAAELVEPLPSPGLLFGFWRELFALGGPLDIPLRRLGAFAPWAGRFAWAAFQQSAHTRCLAPLVRPASAAFERLLAEVGHPELLRRHGHYQFWLTPKATAQADKEMRHMAALGVPTAPVARKIVEAVTAQTCAPSASGLWFPESGHVIDPRSVCQALAQAAISRSAYLWKAQVRALAPVGDRIEVIAESGRVTVHAAVVCAGAWSAPLLAPFGLRAPLESAYGYHVELPGHPAHVEAPIIYMDQKILVTPMAGRLRASSYMEFSGPDAAADPHKPRRLRSDLSRLGYRCEPEGPSWRGPRPVLPDYLPGIGRASGPARLFYAVGHQHIGLTLAPITAELMADLVAERAPRLNIQAFDLRRFGERASRSAAP